MKTFIFKYLLIIAAVAGAISVTPAQAQDLSSMSATYWLKPYKQQLWTPQGFLTLVALGFGGYWIMSGDRFSNVHQLCIP
jgi:hypothetical protein